MQIFQDHTGKTSSMRVMSFIALLGGLFFGYTAIKLNSDIGLYVFSVAMLAAFAPKAIQKYTEKYLDSVPKKD